MDDTLDERYDDPAVAHDVRVLAAFTRVWCADEHDGRERAAVATAATARGAYGRRPPVLCAECAAHLAYAEERRARCPKEPKPYCEYCDSHCYRRSEAAWQVEMMRRVGPRWWRHRRIADGLKHALAGMAARRAARAGWRGETVE